MEPLRRTPFANNNNNNKDNNHMKENNAVREETEVAVEIAGHEITWHKIRYLLCSALEGGSNYWYYITKFVEPEVGDEPWPGETTRFRHLDYPVRKGGALEIGVLDQQDDPGEMKPVNRETLVEGLKIMAKKYLRHFADFVEGGGDANTGDVFLQCVCFGDVIYG